MYEKEFANREEFIEELIKVRDNTIRPRDVLVCIGFNRYGAGINNYHAVHINSMINELLHFEETMVPDENKYKGTIVYNT